MNQENKYYTSSSEERLQMLADLKRAKAILTSTYYSQENDPQYIDHSNFNMFDDTEEEYQIQNEDGSGLANKSHRKSLSTAAGRYTVPEQERGYASAIMLGIMTFVIEILFLTITFFMYR